MSLYIAVQQLFQLIELVLIVRILLSWFPNIDWWKQPFKLIKGLTDPILVPFRRIIPPISGLDLSPIVAFISLEMVQYVLLSLIK